jgi:hypothetical protein
VSAAIAATKLTRGELEGIMGRGAWGSERNGLGRPARICAAITVIPWVLTGCAHEASEADQNRALADKEIAWLKAHPLTAAPETSARPKSDVTCENKIARRIDAAKPELPEYLRMALVEQRLTPWSFVKFDIDEDGRTSNVRPFDSAGYPPFDAQSKKYLEAATFELRPGIAMAIGCVMYFGSSDTVVEASPSKNSAKPK